jgi:uncharacterized membrane protein
MAVAQQHQTTRRLQSPFTPGDFGRDVAPLAAVYLTITAVIHQLARSRSATAPNVARFVNLLLVSLVTGNGVGGERFVHAPLSRLAPGRYLEAEQAITRSYLPMLAIMPASIASGLQVLALMPKRRGAAFWLTVAGTFGMIGTFATTLMELPLNRQTLTSLAEAPDEWMRNRSRWVRFNHVRVLLEVGGWTCLCMGALMDRRR